jgi:hypothetical protein
MTGCDFTNATASAIGEFKSRGINMAATARVDPSPARIVKEDLIMKEPFDFEWK